MAHELQGFPQTSYYGKSNNVPKAGGKIEDEYQKFIGELKTKKEEQPIIPETPVVEEAPIIPETIAQSVAPILNETTTTTKKKKKKTEVVVEE